MSIKVSSYVWENYEGTSSRKLMLLAIADHANDEGVAFPGIQRLADKCNIRKRQAQNLIQKLKAEGVLKVDVHNGIETTSGYTNRYYLPSYRRSVGIPSEKIRYPRDVHTQRSVNGVQDIAPLTGGVQNTTPEGVQDIAGLGVQDVAPKPSVEPSEEPSETPTPTAQIFTHYAALTDNITPYIRDAISDLIDDHGETAVLAAVESAVEATPANPLRWMESHLGETSPVSQDKPEYAPLVEAYRDAVNMVTSYTPTGKDATAFTELHAAGITPQQLSDFINETSHDEYWRGKRLPVSVCARDIGAWLKAQSNKPGNGQAWTGRALGDRPLGAGIRFANGNENATGSSE